MPAVEMCTISLPPAQASYIDALVETGTYASASEVVRAGPRALQARRLWTNVTAWWSVG